MRLIPLNTDDFSVVLQCKVEQPIINKLDVYKHIARALSADLGRGGSLWSKILG